MSKKLSNTDLSEAIIIESTKKIRLVTDPAQVELALGGHLNFQGRQILVVRGGDAAAVTMQVYFRFAREHDAAGEPFRISLRKRGLTHTSPLWKSAEKITGEEMLSYLNRWFIGARLVTNSSGKALELLDEPIPPTFAGLCAQPRYLAMFSDLFETVDDRCSTFKS